MERGITRCIAVVVGMAAWVGVVTAACGQVVISEIMYDPASDERPPVKTEWVEIYNPTEEAVDLAGWFLQDEDGKTGPIPEGVSLAPGEAVVLIPSQQTVENFRAAWGEGFQVIPLTGWGRPGLSGLANNPTEENEILTLRRPDESVADEVNFQNTDPWPPNKPDGPSIYLIPGRIDAAANDDGSNWRRSESGVHGARHAIETEDYSPRDVGSPGTVVVNE